MTVVEYWTMGLERDIGGLIEKAQPNEPECVCAGVGKGMPHTADCKWLAWKRRQA